MNEEYAGPAAPNDKMTAEYLKLVTRGRHPATQAIARWFATDHLAEGLPRALSAQLAKLACHMIDNLDDDPELTAGLRKLLEAKDCFVRAAIAAGDGQ